MVDICKFILEGVAVGCSGAYPRNPNLELDKMWCIRKFRSRLSVRALGLRVDTIV